MRKPWTTSGTHRALSTPCPSISLPRSTRSSVSTSSLWRGKIAGGVAVWLIGNVGCDPAVLNRPPAHDEIGNRRHAGAVSGHQRVGRASAAGADCSAGRLGRDGCRLRRCWRLPASPSACAVPPAVELCRGPLPSDVSPVQVGDTIAAAGITGDRSARSAVRDVDRHYGLRADVCRQQQAVLRYVQTSAPTPTGVWTSRHSCRLARCPTQIVRLRKALLQIPHVLATPEPAVEILTIGATGCTLAVRPFCRNDHHRQVTSTPIG